MTSLAKPIAALARALPPDQGFALIPNRKLYEIYAAMLHCRLLGERLQRPATKRSSFGPIAGSIGNEAVIAAAAIDLDRADTLAPGPGALVPCFVKGLPLASIRALLSPAKARIPWARYRIVPPALPLAAQIEHALDAAQANKTAKNGKTAVAFCGDTATSAELLQQAMARAGKKKLPILFVCHTAADGDEIAATALGHGLPGIVVEAHDAVAVYRVVTESMAHARRGNGPTLIECRPWPLADAPADPLALMEQALSRRGIFTARLKSQTAAVFKQAFAVR
jgi:TPP-dependent pyruvate/acetoin dehydrogenase alpha subunit